MSMRESDFDCPERADAAAYVLGALAPEELERFREHLDGCAQCRTEVAELQPVVDQLPSSVPPAGASEALRARILETVRSEASLLHAAGEQADEPKRAARRFRLGATGAGAIAVAVAVAIALIVVLAGSSGSAEKVYEGKVSAPGALATLRQHDGRSELIVSHMPQPGLGRVYEVWLSRRAGSAEPTSALFDVTASGAGATYVPSTLHGVREVLVTSEPQGGSQHPTRAPLIHIPLAS
jgi:anti-sigma-K factor RskA